MTGQKVSGSLRLQISRITATSPSGEFFHGIS